MKFLLAMMTVDRRIIFLLIATAITVPLLLPLGLGVQITEEVQKVYDLVEALDDRSVVLFSFDYEASTMAELDPMSYAILRHCYSKGSRVLAMTLYAGGVGLAENVLDDLAEELDLTYGNEYAFLGYAPDPTASMLSWGEDVHRLFPTDHYGTPLDSLPALGGVKNYNDVALVVSVTASAIGEYWGIYAKGRYGATVAVGSTAVQAVTMFPYYQAGLVAGFLGGLRGAAEYEKLIDYPAAGAIGMDAQSISHLLIVGMILLGNLGYFLTRGGRGEVRK
jgi:hypothetical protein